MFSVNPNGENQMDIKWLDGENDKNVMGQKWILELTHNNGKMNYVKGDYDKVVHWYSTLLDGENVVAMTIYTPERESFATKTKDSQNRRHKGIAG